MELTKENTKFLLLVNIGHEPALEDAATGEILAGGKKDINLVLNALEACGVTYHIRYDL